ncbi:MULTISPECIES: transcription repressor NadR [Metabacillus]|uniref:Transcription repressor NadR n=1 Tax=Metabacillus rhizolycopersici TaxID=2875709 RepID=A0ABS7UM47_9BACI|nr:MULTISPECIES: transcription repressor NadR [Metabacillus]MBZ5749390.1 transcription repressor NadR [Metabacillus rhizolycopersici]MCM3650616.1 transcription repressor NadR [Metabacillus litoralis]
MKAEKLLGEERRNHLLELLSKADKPITGGELASTTNVSRQVIVQDISLLKAKNYPIMATSQGYVYLNKQNDQTQVIERIIACKHAPELTKEELSIIVDHGVFVKDVIVEHPVYGDLTASIMVGNRNDVNEFIKKIDRNNASYLLQLTGGLHLHTLQADSQEKLDRVCEELDKLGMLVQD